MHGSHYATCCVASHPFGPCSQWYNCFAGYNGYSVGTGLSPASWHYRGAKTGKNVDDKLAEWDRCANAGAAFLGPQLWDKTLACDSELRLELVDLDEFLSETSLGEDFVKRALSVGENGYTGGVGGGGREGMYESMLPPSKCLQVPSQVPVSPGSPRVEEEMPAPLVSVGGDKHSSSVVPPVTDSLKVPAISSSITPLSLESVSSTSTTPVTERGGRPTRQRKEKGETGANGDPDFEVHSQEHQMDLVLDHDFSPWTKRFSEDELKPQPLYTPNEFKDEKYWARRRKNNIAAKRSRDARRLKENQIAMRASYLEKENTALREELEKAKNVITSLNAQLVKCIKDLEQSSGKSSAHGVN